MEGLVVFGIVCNVIQVVDFGLKTISKGREISKKGATADVLDADFISKHLQELSDELKESTILPKPPLSKLDQQVLDLAKKCSDLASELGREVAKLKPAQVAKKWQTFVRLVDTLWKAGRIEEMKTRLELHRRTLDTVLLAKLSRQFDITTLSQEAQVKDVDTNLKAILSGLSSGKKSFSDLSTLISQEASSTRKHVSEEHEKTCVLSAQGTAALRVQNEQEHGRTRQQVESSFRNLTISSAHDQHTRTQQQVHAQFLSTLHFPDMFSRQEMIHEASKKTYQWLFDQSESAEGKWPSFIDWLQGGNNVYWVSGKPGAGKSTLMRFIYDHEETRKLLKTWAGTSKLCVPAFFFWSPGSSMMKSQVGMLRALVHQILVAVPMLIPPVIQMIARRHFGSDYASQLNELAQQYAWTVAELLRTLRLIIKEAEASTKFCLFIDGLDEYEGTQSDQTDLVDLIKDLGHAENVKFCVSSRGYHYFREVFKGLPELKLHDLTRQDMEVFVQEKIGKRLAELAKKEEGKREIERLQENLVGKSDGVFLWLTLAIKQLMEGIQDRETFAELRLRLNSIPGELDQLFAQLLERIPRLHKLEAASIFQHILCRDTDNNYGRPYLVNMVLDIYFSTDIALDPEVIRSHLQGNHSGEELAIRLSARTGGLVEFSDNSNVYFPMEKMIDLRIIDRGFAVEVDFLHRSVLDFFHETQVGKDWLQRSSPSLSKVYEKLAFGNLRYALLLCPYGSNFWVQKEWGIAVTNLFEAAHKAEAHSGLAQTQLMCDTDISLSTHCQRPKTVGKLMGNTDANRYSQLSPPKNPCDVGWIDEYIFAHNSNSRFLFEEQLTFYGVDIVDMAAVFALKEYVIKQVTECIESSTDAETIELQLNKRLISCCSFRKWTEEEVEAKGSLIRYLLALGANPNYSDYGGCTVFQIFCENLGHHTVHCIMYDQGATKAQPNRCLLAIINIFQAFIDHDVDASRIFHSSHGYFDSCHLDFEFGVLELIDIVFGFHGEEEQADALITIKGLLRGLGAKPFFQVTRLGSIAGLLLQTSEDLSAGVLHFLRLRESYYGECSAKAVLEKFLLSSPRGTVHLHAHHLRECDFCNYVKEEYSGILGDVPQQGDDGFATFHLTAQAWAEAQKAARRQAMEEAEHDALKEECHDAIEEESVTGVLEVMSAQPEG